MNSYDLKIFQQQQKCGEVIARTLVNKLVIGGNYDVSLKCQPINLKWAYGYVLSDLLETFP